MRKHKPFLGVPPCGSSGRKRGSFFGNREGIFLIPYEKGEIVSYLNSNATVSSQEYLAEGVKLFVDCRESDYSKYREYLFPED